MKIRLAKESDINFVLSTWLRSYYDALRHYSQRAKAGFVPSNDIFFKEHQEKIKNRLKSSQVLICTAPDEDDQIIGYLVFEDDCLHFCYVKNVFRKMGVAKELKKKAGTLKNYSHHTTYSRYLAKGLVFNPYLFMR